MNLSPKTRKYIYGIAFAVFTLLGGYGIFGAEDVERWLFLAAAILGMSESGLAGSKVEKAPDAETY